MEVFLYNSTVCRLCGEENDSGSLLYTNEDNNQSLCDIINRYLPMKVSDDGELPRTICPGCTIQVEATVEFLNLIINGQKIIRQLYQREREYKKTIFNTSTAEDTCTEKIIYEFNTSEGVYQLEHPISLQVAGLDKPKRKRGRPPKKPKSPEEIAEEAAAREKELETKNYGKQEEVSGKRRRKAPSRFKEVVQGKELERIFKEEGMTDGEESDGDKKKDKDPDVRPPIKEPEVIGHLETSGELVVVVKGKGRGRPKGRMRPTHEECAICGQTFSCVGRYMSHVAQHGPVRYQCAQCENCYDMLLAVQQHQKETGHQGQRVLPCESNEDDQNPDSADVLARAQETSDVDNLVNVIQMDSLPDLGVKSDSEIATINTNDFIRSLVNEEKPSESVNEETDPLEMKSDDVEIGPKGKVKLKCNHCEKTFNSRQSKSLHIKAVHLGERAYQCTQCGVKFAYPRSLALHTLSHRRHRGSPKRYACDLCGKVLNHPSSVVYHKQAEHAGLRYVCSKCGKQFKHRQLLQRHQLVHSQDRPYSCKSCDASFKTKANLLNHQLLHSGVKKFSCDFCKHKFAHKTSLTLHMRWHTGSKPFACTVCGKSFSQKGNLSEHARIHTGEKPYACAVCPRRFTTSSQCRLHSRRHQPERSYACAHCPKRFSSRSSWAAHQKREVGARPFHCTECGRSFLERWALVKHCRRHTGERPFRCPHCPRAFADCSNLNKHKKHVHKQISLLVNEKQEEPILLTQLPIEDMPVTEKLELEHQDETQDTIELDESTNLMEIESDGDEERVIYVAYDVDGGQTAYQILNADEVEADKIVSLYEDGTLMEQQELVDLAEPMSPHHIAVTDEAGNPIALTMSDGTQLSITSSDGQQLLLTGDTQALRLHIDSMQRQDSDDVMTQAQVFDIEKDPDDIEETSSPVAHFYTIV